MKKQVIGLMLTTLMLTGTVYADSTSQNPPHSPHEHRDWGGFDSRSLEKDLKLETSQVEAIKGINKKYGVIYREYRAQIKPIQDEINTLKYSGETPDYNRLRSLFERLNPIHTEIKLTQIHHDYDIRATLTQSQREELDQLRKKKHEKMKEKFQKIPKKDKV
jgi:Spy/CpxP family protein refolding chaperone